MRIRNKSKIAAALLTATVSTALLQAGTSSAQDRHTPPGQVLYVTTNLLEAWDIQDMKSQSELKTYVQRLLNQTPFLPDVLLLQEVRLKSAKFVAEELTRQTSDTYTVAVKPPRRPWTQNPQRRTETDTAVVINSDTMKKVDKGGFISLTYERRHAADKSKRVETTRHARVLVKELDGDMKFAAASVHLQYGHLASKALDYRYQKKWTSQVARVLKKRYPAAMRNIGGDFNETRCRDTSVGASDCTKSPFWNNLVQNWDYNDVMFEVWKTGKRGIGLGGVDFMFTTGTAVDAGSDYNYNKNDPDQFYSDHRFFWGVAGG